MQTPAQTTNNNDELSPLAAKTILGVLPSKISSALVEYAESIDYPVEFVLEMAIAGFLDLDAMTFSDCRVASPGRLREKIEMLQIELAAAKGQLPQ